MTLLVIGEELDGSVVAIPLEKVHYLRERGAFTEIYTASGETFQVSQRISELAIVEWKPTKLSEETAEGATPAEVEP